MVFDAMRCLLVIHPANQATISPGPGLQERIPERSQALVSHQVAGAELRPFFAAFFVV